MSKVGYFDIMKAMAERGLDIRLSLLDNITEMKTTKRGDTQITIGFPGNIIGKIYHGEFIGGLILCNKEQYDAIREELEAKK